MFDAFSGIGGFSLAAQRKGIKIIGHSEIDKYAEKIYVNHFDNLNYGDIAKIDIENLPDFDLLTSGFPCQDLSIAGNRAGIYGMRSSLFFNAVKILKIKKPKYFIFENVASMQGSKNGQYFFIDEMKKDADIITEILDVKPIRIDSALVSAQMRKRLYWTNIKNIKQPKDEKIYLQDILESGYTDKEKCYCIDAGYGKAGSLKDFREKKRRMLVMKQSERRLQVHDKNQYRILSCIECELSQTFPKNWTIGISKRQRYRGIGNSVTPSIIEHILNYL